VKTKIVRINVDLRKIAFFIVKWLKAHQPVD